MNLEFFVELGGSVQISVGGALESVEREKDEYGYPEITGSLIFCRLAFVRRSIQKI